MQLLLGVLRFAVVMMAGGFALLALLSFLGFAVPLLDLLNHFQVFIFLGVLFGLILAALLLQPGLTRSFLVALAATGFIASSVSVVPETVWSMLPREPLPEDGRPVLKLVTHNLFGLNYNMERVARFFFDEDPDIIALQEYFRQQREDLHPLLLERYPYFAQCIGGKRANVALYAKLPFTLAEDGACSGAATATERTSRLIGAFALQGGESFSVLTTHLDWPYPIARQQGQMAELVETVKTVAGPLLVVGDLNSTPWSYALRGFAATAGLERHTRNLVTYPLLFTMRRRLVQLAPFLPLDHIMSRGGIEVHEVYRGEDTGSDHLPVVAIFSVSDWNAERLAP